MRKLAFLLVFVIVAIAANGQTKTINLGKGTYFNDQTDYTLTNTTEKWFLWQVAQNTPITFDFKLTLALATGSCSNVDIAVYGRKFSTDSWTQIGSTVSSGAVTTTYTTTISTTEVQRYREIKISYTGTGTHTVTIQNQELKVWLE